MDDAQQVTETGEESRYWRGFSPFVSLEGNINESSCQCFNNHSSHWPLERSWLKLWDSNYKIGTISHGWMAHVSAHSHARESHTTLPVNNCCHRTRNGGKKSCRISSNDTGNNLIRTGRSKRLRWSDVVHSMQDHQAAERAGTGRGAATDLQIIVITHSHCGTRECDRHENPEIKVV